MKKFLVFLLVLIFGVGIVYILAFSNKDVHLDGIVKDKISIELPKEAGELSQRVKVILKQADQDKIEDIIDYAKEKSKDGSLDTKEGIKEALREAEDRFGTSLTQDTKDSIADSLIKIENMGLSAQTLTDKADKLYRKYGSEFVDHMEEAFVDAAQEAAGNAARKMIDNTKNSIQSIFAR